MNEKSTGLGSHGTVKRRMYLNQPYQARFPADSKIIREILQSWIQGLLTVQ